MSIIDHRLLFSEGTSTRRQQHSIFQSFSEASRHPPSICLGYVDLQSPSSAVDTLTTTRLGSASSQKHSFQVMDGAVVITFGCDKEQDRDDWIDVIVQAIRGTKHFLPLSALSIPESAAAKSSSRNTANSSNNNKHHQHSSSTALLLAQLDFPRKSGYLMKSSSHKKSFSLMKSIPKPSQRWFVLEAGELRYYTDELTSFDSLKDVLDLTDAQLLASSSSSSSSKNSTSFQIKLNDGRKIKFEASSQIEAKDWREAFTRTFATLQTAAAAKGRDEGSELAKSRRFNVFDLRLSAEEKKSLVDAMQQSASSPENSKARFSVANFFKSSRQQQQQQQQQQDNNANATAASNGPSFKVIKSNETAAMIEACLQQNVMVKRLQDIKPLVSCIKGRVALPGEVIIWEGSLGDEFYILEKGRCQVIKDGEMVVGFIQENTSFGELALYNNTIRQATVRVCQLSCIWSFTRQQFRQIANHQNAAAISDKQQFLTQIDLFQKFNRNALEKIAEVMVLRIYQGENERIVKQGDVADRFFMIISGRVLITQSHTLEDLVTGASPKELVRLGPGKYFGESALTESIDHRKATATSLTTTLKCWTIDRSEFVQMFGSLQCALNDSIGFLILKKVKIFKSISDAVLEQISQNLESVHYSEGK